MSLLKKTSSVTSKRKYNKRYCIAFGCTNNNKERPNLSLCTLPRDPERRRKWLKVIGREDLLEVENLKYYSYEVCSEHFEDSDYKIIRQLLPHVIPSYGNTGTDPGMETRSNGRIKYKNYVPAPIEKKVMPNGGFGVSKATQTNESGEIAKPQFYQIHIKEEETEPEIKRQKFIYKLQFDDDGKIENVDNKENTTDKKIQELMILQEQLETKLDGADSTEYKKFAFNLYCFNPHSYATLQTILKLPSKKELTNLKIKIPQGPDDNTIEKLSLKLKVLPSKAKYCSICIDEIELNQKLYYDIKYDEVVGYDKKDGKILPVCYSYVVMIQSLYVDWKQPIAYNLCATKKNYLELDLWINDIMTKLYSIGFEIRSFIANPKPTFVEYATLKNITAHHPYFFIDGRMIYFIFDVPSLLTRIHIDLASNKLKDPNNNEISWDIIRSIYANQQRKYCKSSPKQTLSNLEPNNSITAAQSSQLFSSFVAATIEAHIDHDILKNNAKATAEFVKIMSSVFDTLNDDITNYETIMILEEANRFFAKSKFINPHTGDILTESNKTFQHFQISIQSIKKISEEFINEGSLHSKRLNQNCILDLLKTVKTNCPTGITPIQFIRVFSNAFLQSNLKYAPKVDIQKLPKILQIAEEVMKRTLSNPDPMKSLASLEGETDYKMVLPPASRIIYVSSYLVYKCIAVHKCDVFEKEVESMPNLDRHALFNHFNKINLTARFYGHLKLPPERFIKYISTLEMAFIKNFYKGIQGKVGTSMIETLRRVPLVPLCGHFPKEYLLKLFVRLRIFNILKYNNCIFKEDKSLVPQSLKIIKL